MASKLTYLFGPKAEQWTFDPEYLPFVTPFQIRWKIVELSLAILDLNSRETVLWDMFAGIGTDSMEFSPHVKRVICTELNKSTYDNMMKNISNFEFKNIETYNIDCCSRTFKKANVVFFDPPWGETYVSGKDFDFKDVTLADGTNVVDLAHKIHSKYGTMIIKSPYESSTFEVEFDKYVKKIVAFPKAKLKFLILN